jgi:hypothetical protein
MRKDDPGDAKRFGNRFPSRLAITIPEAFDLVKRAEGNFAKEPDLTALAIRGTLHQKN